MIMLLLILVLAALGLKLIISILIIAIKVIMAFKGEKRSTKVVTETTGPKGTIVTTRYTTKY